MDSREQVSNVVPTSSRTRFLRTVRDLLPTVIEKRLRFLPPDTWSWALRDVRLEFDSVPIPSLPIDSAPAGMVVPSGRGWRIRIDPDGYRSDARVVDWIEVMFLHELAHAYLGHLEPATLEERTGQEDEAWSLVRYWRWYIEQRSNVSRGDVSLGSQNAARQLLWDPIGSERR